MISKVQVIFFVVAGATGWGVGVGAVAVLGFILGQQPFQLSKANGVDFQRAKLLCITMLTGHFE